MRASRTRPMDKTCWIAPLVLSSARAISLAHWPLFHRSQSSALFSRDNPGLPIFAIRAPPNHKLNQKVLRRSVEPTVVPEQNVDTCSVLRFTYYAMRIILGV